MITMRLRNTVVIFVSNDRVRETLRELFVSRGWTVPPASTLNQATEQFRLAGADLALVITDSVSQRDEGPRYDMLGVNFLQQREVDLFVGNIAFILLMFRANPEILEWVNDHGGTSVRVPNVQMSAVADLADQLERDHPPPRKPERPGGGEL